MNLPNKITIVRIAMIPIFVAVYYVTAIPHNFMIAAIIFAVAAFTDFLDGYVARKYNMVTDMGKFLDPIADKVLVLTALVLMLTNGMLSPVFGGICVSLIIAREMIVASLRMLSASKQVVIAADKLGKIKTVLQDVSIFIIIFAFDLVSSDHVLYIIGLIIFALSMVMTVISGVSYVYKNRKVFID